MSGKFVYTGETADYLYLRQGTSSIEYFDLTTNTWTEITFGTSENPGYTISSTCHVLLTTDLVVTGNSGFFTIGSAGIVFDGAGHSVTVNGVEGYPGLISNGKTHWDDTSSAWNIVTSGKPVTVKNIGVIAGTGTGTTLVNDAGPSKIKRILRLA